MESTDGLKVKGMVPLHEEDTIKFDEHRYSYVILNYQDSASPYPTVKISQKLQFKITEIDVESQDELGEYEEEYDQLSELKLSLSDYVS